MNSSYNTGYDAVSGAPTYSPGIWQGVNTVFPSQPAGGLPGDRVPMSPYQQQQTSTHAPYKRPSFKLRKSIQPRQPLTILCELAGTKPHFDFYDVPYEERERRAWQMGCDVEGGAGNNEDNCPWPQIASLALYKLYNDWQSQGYQLPKELTSVPHGGGGVSSSANNEPLGGGRAVDKPPLQQLNELANKMKMTLQYDLVSELGPPNNKVFSYAVKIGTKTYSGQAQNKKAAKQAAASAALADQESWYCPPVHHPPPPGDAETEPEADSSLDSSVPPSKRRAAMDPEMKKLYFGG